jgi:squalene-associated FAD-dependent desaturase
VENRARDVTRPALPRVAVIGGGWAGCASAVALADAGFAVTLYEQGPMLGGRARTVHLDGIELDNGQHLLLGACSEVLALIERLHGREKAQALLHRLPLTLHPFGSANGHAVALAAPRAPAPLHLLLALLSARGLTWRERWGLARDFRELAGSGFITAATVDECFARTPRRAFESFWQPLCLAALNTPTHSASAQTFARVLQAAFTGARANSDYLIPAVALGALVPDGIEALLGARSGQVALSRRVRRIERAATGVSVQTSSSRAEFDAVIMAVSPHRVNYVEVAPAAAEWRRVLDAVSTFRYEPIITVYLAYAQLPLAVRLARLDDAPGQWIFDRGAILQAGEAWRLASVVISASGPHERLDHDALVREIDAQVRRLEPRASGLRWSRAIAERRATYACTAGLARPRAGRIAERLYLAGDYTDVEFPATLEAAVRSGNAAARAVIADFGPS